MIDAILIFSLVWGLGLFLLISNGKHAFARSIGILLLIGGCGSLSVILHDILPSIWPDIYRTLGYEGRYAAFAGNARMQYNFFETALFWITLLLSGITLFGLSYAYAASALQFDRSISGVWRKRLAAALAVPAFATLAWELLRNAAQPAYKSNGVRIGEISNDPAFIGSACVLLAGAYIYARACKKERDPAVIPQMLRTAFLVSLPVLSIYAFDFIAIRKLSITETFRAYYHKPLMLFNNISAFHLAIAGGATLLFFYFVARYGALGLKLRLDRDKMDTSLRAMTAGTRMFNHTIKNEASKINYIGERLRQHIEDGDKEAALRMLSGLGRISAHMLDMTERIKEKTDDIALREQDHELAPLLEATAVSLLPLAEERGIEIVCRTGDPIRLLCDRTHIAEVIGNICLNAIEAIRAKTASGMRSFEPGKITVSAARSGKDVVVQIADNGEGIPKAQWEKVFEPFYTTKNNTANYGIGLSYCYAVMQKHGGSIYIAQSEAGVGTTVALRFPGSRVAGAGINLEERAKPLTQGL